jgi:hypothetical protein
VKNGEIPPKSVRDSLANYLERHKELITASWVERVQNSPAIPTASMTRREIIDHIPNIFDAIIRVLRQPVSETGMEDVQEASVEHIVVRWQKGYALGGVMREIAALRTEFIYQLRLFEETHPDFALTERLFASTTIHGILDYIICDATERFLRLTQSETKSKH